jgi:hypothetical protein
MDVISGASTSNDVDGTAALESGQLPERSVQMLHQLTASVRRFTGGSLPRGRDGAAAPLVRLGESTEDHPIDLAHSDIGMLRGVSAAAADVSECVCPEPCERDHANE